ncbi:MAG: tRNA (guanosine(46)-N7)-methyltransferase TrmB [Mycobacteriaceae bacterium]|nr:tRNA (guanosine(46)-N7)-methyltransferase TrmB [Mycobacteriaceae bacterium]
MNQASAEPRRERVLPSGQTAHRQITSFRARRGAITATQQQAWDRTWPQIGRDVRASGQQPEELTRLDLDDWFGRQAAAVLEIGCGTGTATAAMALAEPDLNLIGVEVYKPGLAQLVQAVEREGIANIRLLRGDAVEVLEYLVGPESLLGVRVFFPDPWPKSRHHKRRLLQPATVALIADRLAPGGVLHAATDHAGYAEWIAQVGAAEPRLRPIAPGAAPISCDRPVTKFESKAQRAGSPVNEFVWGKIEV